MKLNQAGIDLIKHFEGCKLAAYPDPGSGGDPWTIGYGATGPDIKKGLIWTQKQAEDRLVSDLEATANKVTKLLKATIPDNAFSALVSFAYNVGVHNLANSSLLHLINAGNRGWAAHEFDKWCHAAGKTMPGLVARRAAERELFIKV